MGAGVPLGGGFLRDGTGVPSYGWRGRLKAGLQRGKLLFDNLVVLLAREGLTAYFPPGRAGLVLEGSAKCEVGGCWFTRGGQFS